MNGLFIRGILQNIKQVVVKATGEIKHQLQVSYLSGGVFKLVDINTPVGNFGKWSPLIGDEVEVAIDQNAYNDQKGGARLSMKEV